MTAMPSSPISVFPKKASWKWARVPNPSAGLSLTWLQKCSGELVTVNLSIGTSSEYFCTRCLLVLLHISQETKMSSSIISSMALLSCQEVFRLRPKTWWSPCSIVTQLDVSAQVQRDHLRYRSIHSSPRSIGMTSNTWELILQSQEIDPNTSTNSTHIPSFLSSKLMISSMMKTKSNLSKITKYPDKT